MTSIALFFDRAMLPGEHIVWPDLAKLSHRERGSGPNGKAQAMKGKRCTTEEKIRVLRLLPDRGAAAAGGLEGGQALGATLSEVRSVRRSRLG